MTALDSLATNILASFRKGNDTAAIAQDTGFPEEKVSRLLWVARCREKSLPATFLDRARHVKQIAAKAA